MCNYDARTIKEAESLRIIDDVLFRLIGTRKEVCQEILRTLLDDDKLVVKSVTTQKAEVSLNRELILDALCELKDGTLCNVEMQKSDNNNDIKRVRFHTSLVTVNHTPKNTTFDDIPNVKVIYITEYDVFGDGQAITHITRCKSSKKTYKPIDDGEDIIFANATSKQRNKHTRLLKLFLKSNSFYDEMYPALSEAIRHYKDTEKGRDEVCKSIEEYAKDKAIDTAIETCVDFGKTLEETIKYVSSKFSKVKESYITSRFTSMSKNA